MLIKIGNFEFTEVWDGVFYKKLSNYPQITDYVCHTTSATNAMKILECGKLLSARNARKVPVEELMRENRNAANDPADYFDYIMFS